MSWLVHALEMVGSFSLFVFTTAKWMFRRPFRIIPVLEQAERVGVDSVPIIAVSSLSLGMIFALQITNIMALFRAEILVGSAVAMTFGRELAPVFTSLMLVAKNGSAMAAEIGTMRVTEQIDAMETMSVNPIHYLVVPRFLGSIIAFPVLTALSNVVGVGGSYFVSIYMKGVDSAGYLDQMFRFLRPVDIWSGFIKAAIMGGIVSLICCFFGYNTTGGSEGVGKASTAAVVTSSMAVLLSDYVMADIMIKVLY
jgi:phospholipid/cholesterol/gamma-HCH transport system permease protein